MCSQSGSPSAIYCLDDKIDAAIRAVLPFIKEAVLKIKAAEKSRARRLGVDLSPEIPEFELGTADVPAEREAAGGTRRKHRGPRRLSIDAKDWLQSQWEARSPQSNATAFIDLRSLLHSTEAACVQDNLKKWETSQGLTPAQSRAQRFPTKAGEDVTAAFNLHRARSDLDEFEAEIDVLRRVHSM